MAVSAPAGRRLMIGFTGTTVTEGLRRVLLETGAGGVILFARNITSPEQTRDLIAGIRAVAPWPLLFAVDQEGGAVVRFTKGVTVFPGNMALGATDDPDLAMRQGTVSGQQLRAIGFDVNLAPVVDLQTNPANPGIGIRSLGARLEHALPLARALVEGHRRAGVATCLKHFPGKGAAEVDAHLDLPVLELPRDQYFDPHTRIFARLIREGHADCIMTTHMVVTGLDPAVPATMSRKVSWDLLRTELGFRGLLFADDMEMGAIVKRWGVPEAVARAAMAGHDLIPVCHTEALQVDSARALSRALAEGRLDPAEHAQSVERIGALVREHPAPVPIDPHAGDDLAEAIARRAVHLFGDAGRLLPLSRQQPVLLIAPRLSTVVAIEEEVGLPDQGFLQSLVRRYAPAVQTLSLPLDPEPAQVDQALAAAMAAPRVILCTFNARGSHGQRKLLDAFRARVLDRTVFVHLRNPFDQALLPDVATALTPFGYRKHQLRAAIDVVFGELAATGILPARIR
jgi:beta-N-acetylhexosaminidase